MYEDLLAGGEGRTGEPHAAFNAVEHLPLPAAREEPQHAGPFDVDAREEREVLVEVGRDLVGGVVGVDHPLDTLAQRAHHGGRAGVLRRHRSSGGPPMARRGPSLARASQQVPLHQVDAHGSERLELLARLDPFGERGAAALAREPHESAQHRQLIGVPMGAVDQASIDLDEVRMQLQDVRHARIPGPDVVDGEHRRRHRPGLEAAPQLLVVQDRFMLGDLDHPRWKAVQNVVHPRVEHGARAQIDEEAHVVRRRAAVAGGLEARQLELGAYPEVRGVLEPLIGPTAAGNGAAGEQFEAEDRAIGHADDRLGIHADRSGTEELLYQPGEWVHALRGRGPGAWIEVVAHVAGRLCVNSHDLPDARDGWDAEAVQSDLSRWYAGGSPVAPRLPIGDSVAGTFEPPTTLLVHLRSAAPAIPLGRNPLPWIP